MQQQNSLQNYRAKRDFKKTREPAGQKRQSGRGAIFVIQKHQARNLHYDFRLEIDGVLKSWAVPKEPSLNPAVKRLAIAVEDHPLDYADFSGTIPQGEYGAGTVAIWDRGTFANLRKGISLAKTLQEGQIEIDLQGQRLHGGYVLHRIREKPKELWLLIKMKE